MTRFVIMRHAIACAACIASAFTVQAQTPAPFTITGNLTGVNATKIVLSYRVADKRIADTSAVVQGHFSLKGKIAEPVTAYLTLLPAAGNGQPDRRHLLLFYLEPGTITVNGNDTLSAASLSGGITNQNHQQLQQALQPVNQKEKELAAAHKAATAAGQTGAEQEKHYNAQAGAIEKERKQVLAAFIKTHPATVVSLDAITSYGGFFPEATEVAPLYDLLSPAVKNTAQGKSYAATIARLQHTAIGQQAPLFEQPTPEGKMVKLADYRGQYVLVDFWASWCHPCRDENPFVVKAYEKYKAKNFTVLGVSLDAASTKAAWMKAIADDKLTWTQVSDLKSNNAAADLYDVQAIPQNFLIDPQGKIIAKNLRGEELDEKLGAIL